MITTAGKNNASSERNLKAFSENLLRLMQESGLSRKELAAKCGIKITTFDKYAKQKKLPTVKVLLALAQEFNCSIDDLFRDRNGAEIWEHEFKSLRLDKVDDTYCLQLDFGEPLVIRKRYYFSLEDAMKWLHGCIETARNLRSVEDGTDNEE